MWDTVIINPFLNTLMFIYTIVGQNFGIAIILFTLLIRVITYPLTMSQMKGTSAMQELNKNPQWIEAQKKYKNDKDKLAQEQMRLYKELGINPLASCLPTLIQFPIIIGLYQSIIQALSSSPEQLLNLTQRIYPSLLKVSALIPLNNNFLWMDLGAPEKLDLPFLPFGIPVLAIIVVASTYLQGKLMTPPSTDSGDQSAQMGKMMNLYMPFLMGYLAFTLASGLALYFVASNVFGILQYAMMGKLDWKNLMPSRKASAGDIVPAKPSKPAK